jgi:two-component system, NarL family, nitrate/nitrite response regulator NarL
MESKLLIVCDVRLYREGLERSLRRRGWAELAAMDATGPEVLKRVCGFGADLVLLDMAGADSVQVLELLLQGCPQVRVVALGVEEDPDTVLALIEAGVVGYVPRNATVEDLLNALEAAGRGEVVCSPRIAGSLVRRVAALANERPPDTPADVLTEREWEILGLIEQGYSNKQIARTLGVKIPTVKNHVHNILDKLKVPGRGAAAALARGTLSRPRRVGTPSGRPVRANTARDALA